MEKDTVNKKRDFGQKLQDFMASYRGKVIMNYAYSWGAAIVIAGTLFKLTHLPGANLMLWIGMGTEVLVFFISAFDLPRRQTETATSGGIVVVGDGTIGSAGGWTNDLPKTQSTPSNQPVSVTVGANQYSPGTPAPAFTPEIEGINAIYEMQLRSASTQINTIDQVHEQTRKMARQIEELNAVYARMLQAVQVK